MRPTLETLRAAELDDLRELFESGLRVLEIGGGDGFQARMLANWALDVVSLDIPDRPRSDILHFPVQDYDGKTLAFPDGYFDLVFSSNVLEHVRDLDHLMCEMRRVMTRDGLMIHVLPSSVWRFWTSATYYPYVLRRILGAWKRTAASPVDSEMGVERAHSRRSLIGSLVAGPHGEYPSALAELYFFSRARWRQFFERARLEVISMRPAPFFYTGYLTLPLGLSARRRLSRVLGAAATTFVLRKADT